MMDVDYQKAGKLCVYYKKSKALKCGGIGIATQI